MADRDVIEAITQDHREVEQMFAQLEPLLTMGQDSEATEKLTESIIIELIRHAIGEEEYVYPAAREALPGGDELIERELSEHAEAEQIMKRLEKMSPDNVEFATEARALMATIRQHVAEEEGEMLPRLRQACSAEQLIELGGKFETAKKTAPTRPHPAAPDRPPGNKLLGPGVAIVDRVRDMFSGRSKQH